MDEGFDTGPLLKVNRFPIDAREETAWSLERKAQEEMICLFIEFCELAEAGRELPRLEQDQVRMRYLDQAAFERLKIIPADADDDTIQRHARAFFYPPYDCAYTLINGVKTEVLPRLAKQQLAERLHFDDLDRLRTAAASCGQGGSR
jgi:methionyl-tRNA formyltransferase